jgi:2-polyprenyl-6-methoxyphenol hydroxylase-like FAD-dependent oxidoreductase
VYDVIVVGSRCAGASTGMLLARRGYRVLLVDRATFPSDTLSTHFLPPRGVAGLARWGLIDRLRASGARPVNPITFDAGPVAVTSDAEPVDGIAEALCPRRTILDRLLVDAAVEAGCELREATTVEELLWDGGRVAGIRARARGAGGAGRGVTERARLVVGADGRHSRVARLVGAPTYDTHPALIGVFYTYWSGLPVPGVEFHVRAGRHVYLFPTHHDLTCVYVAWPAGEFDAYRADVDGNYRRTLALVPGLAERARDAERVEPFRGTNDLPNYYRTPYGPGWALVGDAGHHKDPTTGMGISDAFRDAELLASAIDQGLSGAAPLASALGGYEAERNRRSRPLYAWTLRSAALADPAPMLPLLDLIKDDPAARTRFMSVITGTVPYWEVFGDARASTAAASGAVPLATDEP